jgi:ATP-dependent RNA helicase RhlE
MNPTQSDAPAKAGSVPPTSTFENLTISPKLLDVLRRGGFTKPTPIQHQAIPQAIAGKDLIGIAQTGTGKTLAFAIPSIQRLAEIKKQVLVVLPTRELALQVEETFRRVGMSFGLKTAVLIGGTSYGKQARDMQNRPHVIISTPGRLIDFMETRRLSLENVGILVLDEADQMFDMGFAPQIKKILERVPKNRQTLLFSATMPSTILSIATHNMKMPVRIEVTPQGTTATKVEHELFIIKKENRLALLKKILAENKGKVLVFSRTKHGAKKISRELNHSGFTSEELHSNRSLNQRTHSLARFKNGQCRVLVATDIAARGIDVRDIELVVNFDLPDNPNDYVHRIGRTGRAGKTGRALSFATPEQQSDVRSIERIIRRVIPRTSHEAFPKEEFIAGAVSAHKQQYWRHKRGFGQGGNRNRSGNRNRQGFQGQKPSQYGHQGSSNRHPSRSQNSHSHNRQNNTKSFSQKNFRQPAKREIFWAE